MTDCQHLVLAVNVSGRQISSPTFVSGIEQLVSKHQIKPERLK